MKFKLLPIVLAATAFAGAANAQDAKTYPQGFFFKPNVGIDYQYTDIDYKNGVGSVLDDSLHGINLHAGARVHKNLGFELGYTQTEEGDKDIGGADTETRLRTYSLDALGYLPVTADGKVELIATAGVAYNKIDISAPGISGDDSETKFRVGGGAQYWFTEKTNLRALVRYQDADFDNTTDHAVLATAGLNYQF